jgi:hypothetical protein
MAVKVMLFDMPQVKSVVGTLYDAISYRTAEGQKDMVKIHGYCVESYMRDDIIIPRHNAEKLLEVLKALLEDQTETTKEK